MVAPSLVKGSDSPNPPAKATARLAATLRAPLAPLAVGRRLASRSVTVLKVALPLLAMVLLGLVLAWPRLNPDPREFRLGAGNLPINVEAEASRMLKPRYVGTDATNQPFTVTAEQATHAGSADRILLAEPKGDVTSKDGSWIAVQAHEGLYDRVKNTLGLRGQVQVFHDAGYEFRTEAADVDMQAGTASGTQPVEGQGPFGHLTAEGFQIFERGSRILFTGKARVELRPDQAKKAEAKR
jgi:lipopolysaccharide export system protein LptC